jgi:hypothetical protein
MTQPSIGLLERLRPPPGFRTEAALGATYSADLLTCIAVLTTMDGGDGEQIRYGRVEAYRALGAGKKRGTRPAVTFSQIRHASPRSDAWQSRSPTRAGRYSGSIT